MGIHHGLVLLSQDLLQHFGLEIFRKAGGEVPTFGPTCQESLPLWVSNASLSRK